MVLCKKNKFDFWVYADLIIPTVALAQGIGRIGCFMAGCCYGKETTSIWGVEFPENALAPSGIKLFPIQLCFSLFDFMMFIALIIISKKENYKGKIFCLYFIFYAIGRFVLEYFRGDTERGSIGLFSTSQFVSIFILIIGLALLLIMKKMDKNRQQ